MRGAWGKAGSIVFPLAEVLTSQGWDAIPAHSGREVLNKLEHEFPSVIPLDMRMPGMSGFDLPGSCGFSRGRRLE